MREIEAREITDLVAKLCVQANRAVPPDVEAALQTACAGESWPPAQGVLADIADNLVVARQQALPVCQDTGMACVFVQLGQEVHITGGALAEAIDAGVRQGYAEGYLRKSVVADPLQRNNTGDNTPAAVTYDVVPGAEVKITVAPKGFGSENMSRIAMLTPADGRDGVVAFVLETVRKAGSNPCPPIVVGVGIGGSFDKAALLAKRALLRPLDVPNGEEYYAQMEEELLEKINQLGIGPAGYGGRTTALAVAVEKMPTHIAGLPVAVNISCHVTRRASGVL